MPSHPRHTRSLARLRAVQALYLIDQTSLSKEQALAQFIAPAQNSPASENPPSRILPFIETTDKLGKSNANHLITIVHGVNTHCEAIDAALRQHLNRDWSLERLDITLRALMRCGCCELIFIRSAPDAAIINDYVNIAHSFFDGREPGMSNAILDAIAIDYRQNATTTLNAAQKSDGGPDPQP